MNIRYSQSLVFAAIVALVTACGTNPVTGKKEIQFVSESSEIQIGEKNYAPARQAEGGEMEVMPELTAYVNEVGQKLARVSVAETGRNLPYEFKVLNNSVPNAWAMPGGKIAINRGLLVELKNESELAAVLGHEIVHAAARHGAKAQERGTLMQAGMAVAQIGAAVGGVDQDIAGLALAGTGIGLQAMQMKYGRDQELQSDDFGTKYMKLAGYDPIGAVTLQETFVRISNQKGGKQGFFDRMFASHPPSMERVEKNKQLAAQLGAGGEIGEQKYNARIASLMKAKPAYDKFDQAVAALKKKEYGSAATLAGEASKLMPREGRFHELQGEIELAQKNYKAALPHYERAIQHNPNYFGSYLGAGIAQYESGNKAKGQEWLKRSNDLLPTQPATYYLGKSAQERGDRTAALQYFKAAAGSGSSYGALAAKEFVTMDIGQNPQAYVATGAQLDSAGRVVVVVQNRSPIALTNIRITPVLIDASGRVGQAGTMLQVGRALEPNQQVTIQTGLKDLSAEQQQALRIRVDGAQVVEGAQVAAR